MVNRNLSINILDEHSSIISYEDSRSIKNRAAGYTSADSEKPKSNPYGQP